MNGSIAAILTGGFGNGTFAGSPALVVTMGYGIAEYVPPAEPVGRRVCGLSASVREYRLTASVREYDLSASCCEC